MVDMATQAGVLTHTIFSHDDPSAHESHLHSGRLSTASRSCSQHLLAALSSSPPSRAPNPQPSQPSDVPFSADLPVNSDAARAHESDDDGYSDSNENGGQGGDDGDDNGNTETTQPAHPLASQSTAAPPTTGQDDAWEHTIQIPGSRNNKMIYLTAPFGWGKWTREQWWDRFKFVKKELEALVYKHLRLVNLESRPVYSPRMVGTSPSDARPSVVVTCREVDFKNIRGLFRSRAEEPLCLGKQSTVSRLRFPFGQRVGKGETTIPRLGLVYYRTRTPTVIEHALENPLMVQLRDDGISCGGIIQCGKKMATLGVAIDLGERKGILTVDHLIFSKDTRTLPSSHFDTESPLSDESDCPSSWGLNHTGSNRLWEDDDEYDDLDTDEPAASDQKQLDPRTALLNRDDSQETKVLWPAHLDGTRGTDEDSEEWDVLASSAQLAPSAAYLDWALVWPRATAQNLFLSRLNTVFPEGHGGKGVALRGSQDKPTAHLAAIYIISGIRGILDGRILSLPSFLSCFPGEELGEAWTVILDSVHGPILGGECGSTVVDKATNKVYGHVVGSDPHGNAYVVPLANVFAQVMRSFDGEVAALRFVVSDEVSEPLAERLRPIDTLGSTVAIIRLSRTFQRVISLLSNFTNAERTIAEIEGDCLVTESVLKYIREQLVSMATSTPLTEGHKTWEAGTYLHHLLKDNVEQLQLDADILENELSDFSGPPHLETRLGRLVAKGQLIRRMPMLRAIHRSIVTKRLQLQLVFTSLKFPDQKDEASFRMPSTMESSNILPGIEFSGHKAPDTSISLERLQITVTSSASDATLETSSMMTAADTRDFSSRATSLTGDMPMEPTARAPNSSMPSQLTSRGSRPSESCRSKHPRRESPLQDSFSQEKCLSQAPSSILTGPSAPHPLLYEQGTYSDAYFASMYETDSYSRQHGALYYSTPSSEMAGPDTYQYLSFGNEVTGREQDDWNKVESDSRRLELPASSSAKKSSKGKSPKRKPSKRKPSSGRHPLEALPLSADPFYSRSEAASYPSAGSGPGDDSHQLGVPYPTTEMSSKAESPESDLYRSPHATNFFKVDDHHSAEKPSPVAQLSGFPYYGAQTPSHLSTEYYEPVSDSSRLCTTGECSTEGTADAEAYPGDLYPAQALDNFQAGSAGESSAMTAVDSFAYSTHGAENYLPYGPGESSMMQAVDTFSYSGYEPDSGGRDTPRPLHSQTQGITAGSVGLGPRGDDQDYNDGFVVHPSSQFQPGQIIKVKIIMRGSSRFGDSSSEIPKIRLSSEQDGEAVYQTLRRFIIVANDEGHSTCVPILTYDRQGCRKRGVKPSSHGIIYQEGNKPRTLAGEPALGFKPARASLYKMGEQLVKEARVNYAKPQIVKHSARVAFIGSVVPEDFDAIVRPAVDQSWEPMRRYDG